MMFCDEKSMLELGAAFDDINKIDSSQEEPKFIIEDEDSIIFNILHRFTNEEKIDECSYRLTEIDKEIIEYENNIDKIWNDVIEPQLFSDNDIIINFDNKFDFFDFMIEKEEYKILIKKQAKLNLCLELLNDNLMN